MDRGRIIGISLEPPALEILLDLAVLIERFRHRRAKGIDAAVAAQGFKSSTDLTTPLWFTGRQP